MKRRHTILTVIFIAACMALLVAWVFAFTPRASGASSDIAVGFSCGGPVVFAPQGFVSGEYYVNVTTDAGVVRTVRPLTLGKDGNLTDPGWTLFPGRNLYQLYFVVLYDGNRNASTATGDLRVECELFQLFLPNLRFGHDVWMPFPPMP